MIISVCLRHIMYFIQCLATMSCIPYLIATIVLHSGVECVKVRDKFDMKRLAETRLRVFMPEVRTTVSNVQHNLLSGMSMNSENGNNW